MAISIVTSRSRIQLSSEKLPTKIVPCLYIPARKPFGIRESYQTSAFVQGHSNPLSPGVRFLSITSLQHFSTMEAHSIINELRETSCEIRNRWTLRRQQKFADVDQDVHLLVQKVLVFLFGDCIYRCEPPGFHCLFK